MSIEEIMSEKLLIDDEIKDITNDLSYKTFRGEKINDEYERDCEIKINQLLQDYNGLDIEMRKKERVLMEEKYLAVSQQHEDSLIMGDEHLDTIPSIENLVPILSESEDFSDNESKCDVPECDETSLTFTTFLNPLFDSNDDFTSSDDVSLSDEELLEEFSGKLAHIDPILPGIKKADFDLEEEIRLVENLLYGNSSPRPPEELNLEIADTILELLSPSPILVDDSDSHTEEIDLFLATDDSMPPGIKDDDYDSEGDIRFLEELLSNDPFPLPENESSNLDHFNDPSPPRPPPEPLDVEIFFDFKPDTGVVTTKVVGDISEHDVLMPKKS
ncbi:hypothetical protein Tco_0913004 [Tanacetum coccineum]